MRETDHLEDTGVNVRIIVKWIFNKWDGGFRIGTVADFFLCSN
jgi:hypothetical protein